MESITYRKSFEFATAIVQVSKELTKNKQYELSSQLIRSGTSIGANLAEVEYAQSKPDFISKLSIALKEAAETKYWLKLLERTEDIAPEKAKQLIQQADEIMRLLTASIKTAKKEKTTKRSD